MSVEDEDILKRQLKKYELLGYDKLAILANKKFSDGVQLKRLDTEYQLEISVRWMNMLHKSIRVEVDIEQYNENAKKGSKWKKAHGFVIGKGGQVEIY